jgi:hypothetical protein
MSARLNHLRKHFAQNQLLRKILAAHDDAISVAGATEDRQQKHEHQQGAGDSFRADLP